MLSEWSAGVEMDGWLYVASEGRELVSASWGSVPVDWQEHRLQPSTCVYIMVRSQTAWVLILVLSLTSRVTLGLLLSCPMPQFPHLPNGGK